MALRMRLPTVNISLPCKYIDNRLSRAFARSSNPETSAVKVNAENPQRPAIFSKRAQLTALSAFPARRYRCSDIWSSRNPATNKNPLANREIAQRRRFRVSPEATFTFVRVFLSFRMRLALPGDTHVFKRPFIIRCPRR